MSICENFLLPISRLLLVGVGNMQLDPLPVATVVSNDSTTIASANGTRNDISQTFVTWADAVKGVSIAATEASERKQIEKSFKDRILLKQYRL